MRRGLQPLLCAGSAHAVRVAGMSSFPSIDSQDVLAYAYGSSAHAPHLHPGWVDPEPAPAPAPAPTPPARDAVGDVSTQPLYLPHEFDDSTAPSHLSSASHSNPNTGSSSAATHSYSTGTTGSTNSALSIPHPRRGAHIDYTSSESGGSFASGGTTALTAGAGWTLETNVESLPPGSTDELHRDGIGAGAHADHAIVGDNEAAQSERLLAGAHIVRNIKSGDNAPIGAIAPHALPRGGRDTYMHPHQPDAALLPPFETSQEEDADTDAYVVPPPFTFSGLHHSDPVPVLQKTPPPSTRTTNTNTAVAPSAASGILTPVSEAHSTASASKPRSPQLFTIREVDTPAEEESAGHMRARTPSSVKDEVPETPPAGPELEESAELGTPPKRRPAPPSPPAIQSPATAAAAAREHRFLPRKGERAPSPVPPSRESSFGALSPRTRYMDETGRKEREAPEGKGRGRGRGKKGKKGAEEEVEGVPDSRRGKKPLSSAGASKPLPHPRTPTPSPPEPSSAEHDPSGPHTLPTQPSTTASSLVRRSFANIFPALDTDSLHAEDSANAEGPRTGTTATGARGGFGGAVGSGQLLVEGSSSAPLVEEPEQEEDAEMEAEMEVESARAEPGSSSRRVERSTQSRGTRETRTSKGSRSSGLPSESQARRAAEVGRPAKEIGLPHIPVAEEEEGVQGTQEVASPSQHVMPVTPPRSRGKRARPPTEEQDEQEEEGVAKRQKGPEGEPRTPNKAREARKVYSARKKRKSGDVAEEVGEAGAVVLQEAGPSKPVSRGKRKAEKAQSDAESVVSKRPKRGTTNPEVEPSDRGSVASKGATRERAHNQPDAAAESESTSKPRRTAAVKKPAKAAASKGKGKGKAPEVIAEEPEAPQESAPPPATLPDSEVVLEVAADEEPTPSPAIRAGAPFSRVFALWSKDKCYYPATVTAQVSAGRQAGQFNVLFDDESISCVPVDSLRAAVLKEGDTIAIQKGRQWREARIMEGAFSTVQLETLVRVRFDEGSQSTEKVTVRYLRVPKNAVTEWDDRKLTSEQVTPQVVVKKEPEDRRKRAGTAGPGAGSASDSPLAPPSQRHRIRPTSAVLEGHAFIVTSKEDKSKQDLVQRIQLASGEVSEEFGDFFNVDAQRITWKGAERGLTAVWCIAREVSTTPKYLMALALGVPCLGSKFISDVLDQKTALEEWAPYLLAAGRSDYLGSDCSQKVDQLWGQDNADGHPLLDDIMASNFIRRPLRSKRILLILSKKDGFFKGRLVEVFWAMGAEHVETTPAFSLDEDLDSYDFLYWPDEVEMKISLPKAKKVRMVGPGWVKQCLITGLCVPVS
ncbi:hypothetical protein CALCODRAFT_503782 [Calocera cornea HHB12733]|uniref:BRCT domain-containing protein n=1 Tax=Calocera cornea HHB12733 TaxID=1353952 RepID=A0A165CRH4_9BASI|nr:hypothetical protein CALCODRAFT_503782 [Calocera cornea HHB12733]